MSDTLLCIDTFQRNGYTVIDGEKVVQHTCIIPINDPENMRVSMTKLNTNLYKAYRDTCRMDFAIFEDSAYQLQEKYLNTRSEREEG